MIGAGDKTLSGYNTVTMSASSGITGDGTGRTTTAARWTLSSPSVSMNAAADQRWLAADLADPSQHFDLAFAAPAAAQAPAASTGAGGRLVAEGRSVSVATTLQARSGRIELSAAGPDIGDGVTLSAGAKLDASGTSKDYHDRSV